MSHTTLISVAELAQHVDDAAFVIFDCRHELTNPESGSKAYSESHLPTRGSRTWIAIWPRR